MPTKTKEPTAYETYPEYLKALADSTQRYENMPIDNAYSAYVRAAMSLNPQIMNRRVKHTSSLPVDYTKDEIAEMLKTPNENELGLRQTSHGLEWGAYPYFKIRKTYQDINTYRHYFYPAYLEEDEADADDFWREGKLLDKYIFELKPHQWAHQIAGQAVQEGKVAYVNRYKINKAHNKAHHAFMQQLPSDYWKIVGFNSVSKYTVAFDLMYFLTPGADWRAYGDLFKPYMDDFSGMFVEYDDMDAPTDAVFASNGTVRAQDGRRLGINLQYLKDIKHNAYGNPDIRNVNGRWLYWVVLPVEDVWVFEVDDTHSTVATPLTGLFLAMDQLSAYEEVQLEIVQNPLVSVVLGEIPYFADKDGRGTADNYQLSPAGRTMFEAFWYQMLGAANTGGIGIYSAPFQNMRLESLSEAPNATDISTKGYQYAVSKAGMAGLIPINDNPRAGSVNVSLSLEERFCTAIYAQFENMMNRTFKKMRLKYDWRFKMFGGIQSDEKELKAAQNGMSSGLLPDVFKWYALNGISIFSDLAMSRMLKASGVLDMRLPLISAYSMKQSESGLPPQPGNEGGRPTKDINDVMGGNGTEAQEEDLDG